ncbi:MAG TPA: hypothetical protein VM639_18270 [Dongiaceae bacterium]|nr:hypothetical protein [Dongiaceae bacterium]
MDTPTLAALLHQPAFASLAINLVVGLIALAMHFRMRRLMRRPMPIVTASPAIDTGPTAVARAADAEPASRAVIDTASSDEAAVAATTAADAPPPVPRRDDALVRHSAPLWLGACAGFHLLNVLIFALVLLPAVATALIAAGAGGALMADAADATQVLLPVCVLIGLSALLLANLTERLTIDEARRGGLPLWPATIMLGVLEAIMFAFRRPDLGYLVGEGAWLLACILMTAGLIRLSLRRILGAATRSFALATCIGFLLRSLLSLLGILQVVSAMLLAGSIDSLGALGGLIGDSTAALPMLKAIATAWTGVGLLLMAGTWRVSRVFPSG